MSDKSFATLSSSLLARKGCAKPAMRPQSFEISSADAANLHTDHSAWNDLGWNDMGEDAPVQDAGAFMVSSVPNPVEVIPLSADTPVPEPFIPAVLAQQEVVRQRVEGARRSALADGRRAAFTLRVDADRHLKLRLACALHNFSAQQLVTQALDRLLDELDDVSALAAHLAAKRS